MYNLELKNKVLLEEMKCPCCNSLLVEGAGKKMNTLSEDWCNDVQCIDSRPYFQPTLICLNEKCCLKSRKELTSFFYWDVNGDFIGDYSKSIRKMFEEDGKDLNEWYSSFKSVCHNEDLTARNSSARKMNKEYEKSSSYKKLLNLYFIKWYANWETEADKDGNEIGIKNFRISSEIKTKDGYRSYTPGISMFKYNLSHFYKAKKAYLEREYFSSAWYVTDLKNSFEENKLNNKWYNKASVLFLNLFERKVLSHVNAIECLLNGEKI